MAQQILCNRCNQPISFAESKNGKMYPINNNDRKDFHSNTCTTNGQLEQHLSGMAKNDTEKYLFDLVHEQFKKWSSIVATVNRRIELLEEHIANSE